MLNIPKATTYIEFIIHSSIELHLSSLSLFTLTSSAAVNILENAFLCPHSDVSLGLDPEVESCTGHTSMYLCHGPTLSPWGISLYYCPAIKKFLFSYIFAHFSKLDVCQSNGGEILSCFNLHFPNCCEIHHTFHRFIWFLHEMSFLFSTVVFIFLLVLDTNPFLFALQISSPSLWQVFSFYSSHTEV